MHSQGFPYIKQSTSIDSCYYFSPTMQIQEKFDWSTSASLENLEEGFSCILQYLWLQLHRTGQDQSFSCISGDANSVSKKLGILINSACCLTRQLYISWCCVIKAAELPSHICSLLFQKGTFLNRQLFQLNLGSDCQVCLLGTLDSQSTARVCIQMLVPHTCARLFLPWQSQKPKQIHVSYSVHRLNRKILGLSVTVVVTLQG